MAAEASRRSNHRISVVKLGDRLEQSGVVTQCAIIRSLEVRHRLWNGWRMGAVMAGDASGGGHHGVSMIEFGCNPCGKPCMAVAAGIAG